MVFGFGGLAYLGVAYFTKHNGLQFIHFVAKDNISFFFFFFAEWYSVVYIYHIVFIQLLGDGHLSRFRISAPVN